MHTMLQFQLLRWQCSCLNPHWTHCTVWRCVISRGRPVRTAEAALVHIGPWGKGAQPSPATDTLVGSLVLDRALVRPGDTLHVAGEGASERVGNTDPALGSQQVKLQMQHCGMAVTSLTAGVLASSCRLRAAAGPARVPGPALALGPGRHGAAGGAQLGPRCGEWQPAPAPCVPCQGGQV
jgi:hypothetical protein